MDYPDSEEIEEESPCFIVPDSQSDERETAKQCNATSHASLRELAMLQGTHLVASSDRNSSKKHGKTTKKNVEEDIRKEEVDDLNVEENGSYDSKEISGQSDSKATSSSESVFPNSSTTSSNSLTQSSSTNSTREEQEGLVDKKMQQFGTLIEQQNRQTVHGQAVSSSQEDLFSLIPHHNKFLTSTPMINPNSVTSLCNPAKEPSAHLTPLERNASTETFKCLQLSGEVIVTETSSSDNVVSPSSEDLKPESPTSSKELLECDSLKMVDKEGQNKERSLTQKNRSKTIESEESTNKEINVSAMKTVDKCQNETGLPQWQKECLGDEEERRSSLGSMTRTTSNASTSNENATFPSNEGTSLHQWQSPQNESDELFEPSCSNSVDADVNLHDLGISSSKTSHPKGLELPELSQDIFHQRPKGISTDITNESEEHRMPDNDIIMPSQEDNGFRLYLTQSQSSNPPSQVHHLNLPPGHPTIPTTSVTYGYPVENNKTSEQTSEQRSSEQRSSEQQTSGKLTLEQRLPDNIPEQSTTNIDKPRNTNANPMQLSPDSEMVTSPEIIENFDGNTTQESVVDKRAVQHTTDMVLLTESTESGHTPFHFSPPSVLLKPMHISTPPTGLETTFESEIQTEISNPTESSSPVIETTSEFQPALPEIPPTTLSLSVPVPCDESPDENISSQDFEFNLQKSNFVPGPERSEAATNPSRPVFTNVRERLQATKQPVEVDPFEFTDEIHASPNKMAKAVGRKRSSSSLLDGTTDKVLGESDNQMAGNKRRSEDLGNLEKSVGKRRKLNEIPKNTEVDFAETSKEPEGAKRTLWKNVKTRTITTRTKSVEREIITTYTDQDGNVVASDTTHEFDEPTYSTSATESEDVCEVVEDNPHQTNSTNTKKTSSSCFRKRLRSETGQNAPSEELTKAKQIMPKRNQNNPVLTERSLRKKYSVQEQREVKDFREGSRVFARWFDKHYYPGKVMSNNKEQSKCRILFDDGDTRNIQEQDILDVEYLPRDQPVMFREEHEDCYDNGVIRGFYKALDERGYKVAREDGSVQNCPRSRVILSAEQAAIFLSLQTSSSLRNSARTNRRSSPVKTPSPTESVSSSHLSDSVRSTPRVRSSERANVSKSSPNTKAGNASGRSREKLVNTSRNSEERSTNVSRNSEEKSGSSRRSWGSPNKKVPKQNEHCVRSARKVTEPASDKHAKKLTQNPERKSRNISSSETPKSSHKSTTKKQGTGNNTGRYGETSGKGEEGASVGNVRRRLCTEMQMVHGKIHTTPTRSSPRKSVTRKDSEGNEETLVLPTDQDLFRGYGFIITGSDVNRAAPDVNSLTEECYSFNRKQVCQQIEAGGGVVLPTFNEEDTSDDQSYLLLSNSFQTTAKYFYALVTGVPCLSHVWVRDCCTENRLIGYKNYLLPAGKDLITGELVEEQKKCTDDALRKMKIYLVGDEKFKDQWRKVLHAAGCEVVIKLPANVIKELQYGNRNFKCDVIVVGSGEISHSTIRKARLLGVPTVTINWLKQCILTGRHVDFNSHPSFTYRVKGEQ